MTFQASHLPILNAGSQISGSFSLEVQGFLRLHLQCCLLHFPNPALRIRDLHSLSSVFTIPVCLFRILDWEREQNLNLSSKTSGSGVWSPADLDEILTPRLVSCFPLDTFWLFAMSLSYSSVKWILSRMAHATFGMKRRR